MNKSIEWSATKVKINLIDPTPENYKIKNALGYERFKESLKQFGLAGTVILNPSGKRYVLIDGNSRIEEARAKKRDWVWASVPSKPLSPKQFKEMSAMFDYAKAGDVDIQRIERDFGNEQSFFQRYGMQVPPELLEKIGTAKGANLKEVTFPGKKGKEPQLVDIKMVQLFFTVKEEEQFRKWEEKLMKKFRTSNVTETVFAAFKNLAR